MSEIRATTVSDIAGTGPVTLTKQSAAKAAFLYNQVANTVTDSENVSSISDDGTGQFTVSFSSSFSSASIMAGSSTGNGSVSASGAICLSVNYRTTTYIECAVRTTGNVNTDVSENTATLFGDLA